MVQKLMAELKVLVGQRAPPGGAAPAPSPPTPQPQQQQQLQQQQPYTRKDLKQNLHRHMSIVLDRSVDETTLSRYLTELCIRISRKKFCLTVDILIIASDNLLAITDNDLDKDDVDMISESIFTPYD